MKVIFQLVGKATTDTLTNKTLTGAAMNGTLGATTPSTVAATTLTTSSTVTHNGGTANGVAYLDGSKVLTTGSALVFDGTNLGVGVTPSAWSQGKAIEVLEKGYGFWNGTSSSYILANAYYNGGFKYGGTGQASYYYQYQGAHVWSTAASGTAGNPITFTQAMTLTAAGDLGIGTTSPNISAGSSGSQALTVSASASARNALIELKGTRTSADQVSSYIRSFSNSGATPGVDLQFYRGATDTDGFLTISTSGSERARITSSGAFRLGTTNTVVTGAEICSMSGSIGISVISTGGTSNHAGAFWNNATSGDNVLVRLYTDTLGDQRGTITYNRGAGVVAYNTTSDYRAKDIYGSITDSGALIDSVPVYMGKMKGATQERPMFIAHETPAYAHTGEKDAVDADGKPVYQQMDTSALVPVMWAEIQSLRKRLTALEQK